MRNFITLLFFLWFGLTQVNGQKDSVALKNIPEKITKIIQPVPNKSSNTTSAEPDPASIFGYCAWTDPATERKHLPMGQNRTTGQWEYALGYPTFAIQFIHRTRQDGYGNPLIVEKYYSNSGPFLQSVDSAGNSSWELQRIVAFKYKFNFNFDRNYNGDPIGTADGTIRYNPDLWQFKEIIMKEWRQPDIIAIPTEDFPVTPVKWTIRKLPFTGLPNF